MYSKDSKLMLKSEKMMATFMKKGNSLSEQKDDISKWGKPLVFQKFGGFGIKNQINWLWLWCSFIIRPTCSIWKGKETFSIRRKIKNIISCEIWSKNKTQTRHISLFGNISQFGLEVHKLKWLKFSFLGAWDVNLSFHQFSAPFVKRLLHCRG